MYLKTVNSITMNCNYGTIHSILQDAIDLSYETMLTVHFRFNGVDVVVPYGTEYSNEDLSIILDAVQSGKEKVYL